MFVGFCFIILVLSLICCNSVDKQGFEKLYNEWEGKTISFPKNTIFTIQGKDTLHFSTDGEYKILSYVDSAGCTSCKMQLHKWEALMMEFKKLSPKDISYIFYICPKDKNKLNFLLQNEGFVYPICIDEQDELNRLNQFPSDMTFQTFLLDKENKVVAIGNPILNPKVKELYLKLITGSRSEKSQVAKTQVSVNQEVLDFGSFPKTEKQERSFVLTNTGTGLLVVHDVTTSCGCTKVKYNKQPVRPGETLELKVTYEAEETGHFNKTLRVYCNADNSPLRLSIQGNVN